MKELLIFAGTTEGRQLSEYLAEAGICHTICVATEYGEIVLKNHPLVRVRQGRMEQEEIRAFIQEGDFQAVIDATHPYAKAVTQNVKQAMEGMEIPYFRLKRESHVEKGDSFSGRLGKVTWFDTEEACEKALEEKEGNILLTTGSKGLGLYCVSEKIKSRLYVRVLPSVESISLCEEQGICGKQIIAMQGPFTAEMNEAMLRQYHISCLVTKESGRLGGYEEKLEAAARTGAEVFVIGRPREEGMSFGEICRALENICKTSLWGDGKMEILLAGVGMGHKNSMTAEVKLAIEQADILLGAERLLAPYSAKEEKRPIYQAKDIIPYLRELRQEGQRLERKKVVVLFSGDSGFYSGCHFLYKELKREIEEKRLNASLQVLAGISSVSYLASLVGESYEDAKVYSLHGKKGYNLIQKIRSCPKTFFLTSGVKDVRRLGKLLTEADMGECQVITGYQLSYEQQTVKYLLPKECCELQEEGLYTCMVKNPCALPKRLTHGLRDEAFIREQIPMTKEEVREISLCKLGLQEGAVVYDIGSGTGSIAVEVARLSDTIQVYAIERNKAAVSLIEKNKEKFGLENITVIETEAPEGLDTLPMATHGMIGGSGKRMGEILTTLHQINPRMRIVIHAISMETICEIREILSSYSIEEESLVQIQVNRVKKMGTYHLPQAENPVWIFSFQFTGEGI